MYVPILKSFKSFLEFEGKYQKKFLVLHLFYLMNALFKNFYFSECIVYEFNNFCFHTEMFFKKPFLVSNKLLKL